MIIGGSEKAARAVADIYGLTNLRHYNPPMGFAGDLEAIKTCLDFIESQNPIEGDYEIEVSSPGIDRPLTRLSDFTRWKGHDAKIELSAPQDGRKRFKGRLEGLDGQDVLITTSEGHAQFPFRAILEAKLILTNKLIEEDLKAKKNANKQEKV